MHNATISVIIGTYNPDISELAESVNSIISQTFTDWELLLYDDGSCESCTAKIRELSLIDKRIVYLRSDENKGLANALNECICKASGIYIARMDDDDISLPNRFQEQYDFLTENQEYAWVGTEAVLFDETGDWGIASRPEKPEKKDFLHSSPFIHPSVMFRKSVFEENGGYSDSRICSRCEDYELFMRLYSNGYKGYNIQKKLIKYREKSKSFTRALRYSFYEMLVRKKGFKGLGLISVKSIAFIIKPMLVWLASLMPETAQKIRTNRTNGDHVSKNVEENKKREAYYQRNLSRIHSHEIKPNIVFSKSGVIEYVLSPIIYSYSVWVLQNAEKNGINKLFFLARDSYLSYIISKKICEKEKINIECRYFYCSRYSLRIPMYSENIPEALEYICRSGIDVTFRKILLRSGFDSERINSLLPQFEDIEADKIIPRIELPKIRERLKNCGEYIDALKTVSYESWDAVRTYFAQEGMLEERGVGIVDSGWVGSTQKSINDIRKRCGCTAEVEGYYFGLFEIPLCCNAEKYHTYYFSPEKNIFNKVFFSNCLIEGMFRGNHGTTCGYAINERTEPILSEAEKEPMLEKIHDAVVQYADAESTQNKFCECDTQKHIKVLGKSLKRFMWQPTRYEAETFGKIRFSDDLLDENMKEIAPLLSDDFLKENHFMNKMLVNLGVRNAVIHESAWYEASAVRNGHSSYWHRCSYAFYKTTRLVLKKYLKAADKE